ncbi:MAG: NADPH-dependent F420 reductase [Pseudomonadota bacterium]|nr:NADPH-dependent F420 reductase [Pseudomonadota bacterium]
MIDRLPVIAVLGGTGEEGSGLSTRWVAAGYRVLVGSRSSEKAEEVASTIGAEGMDNLAAAAACDIAVLTVPYQAQRSTLTELRDALQGKILVDVTVPLVPPKVMRVQLPEEGSAAQIAQSVLGDGVRVVSAFQNVSAAHLKDPDYVVDCDVLVTGDDPAARTEIAALAEAAGLTAIEAGPLDNAAAAEALTSLLIWINRKYKSPGAGVRITALPDRKA